MNLKVAKGVDYSRPDKRHEQTIPRARNPYGARHRQDISGNPQVDDHGAWIGEPLCGGGTQFVEAAPEAAFAAERNGNGARVR